MPKLLIEIGFIAYFSKYLWYNCQKISVIILSISYRVFSQHLKKYFLSTYNLSALTLSRTNYKELPGSNNSM